MPRNPEDIPVTSASLRVRGDIYSSVSDSPDVRFIDSSSQDMVVASSSNAAGTAVDPVAGTTLPSGFNIGVGQVIADYVSHGLYNASFFVNCPDTTISISDENPLPYWTQGGTTANGLVWNRVKPAAYNSTFLLLSGNALGAGDDTYMEQYVPVRGYEGYEAAWGRVVVLDAGNAAKSANAVLYLNLTYFDSTGTQVGNAQESTLATNVLPAVGDSDLLATYDGGVQSTVPNNAAFVRFRFGLRSSSVVAGPVAIYFGSTRLAKSTDIVLINAPASTNGKGVSAIRFNSNRLAYEGISFGTTTTASFPWSPAIVALPFTFNNLAATATNNMQPWDNAVAQGTPYIDMPFRGTVVGLSYRISGARTGGTFNVRARTGGGTYLLSTGALGTGASLTSSTTQQINTSAGQFGASTALGVDVVTSALAPTTLNISVIMWIAIEWTGN